MNETADRIRSGGGEVLTCQTDLTDEAQVKALVQVAGCTLGGVDCVIHAVGGFFSATHDITSMEQSF